MKNQQRLITRETCAWPNLFHLDRDRIGAVIFNRASHGLEEGSLELWVYHKCSDVWQYLSTPCPHPVGQNRMHSCCGTGRDGSIHVLSSGFSIVDRTFIKLESLWHSHSIDGGSTWKITRNLTIAGITSPVIPHGSLLCSDEGHLLATVYRSFGKDNPSYTWLIRSEDNGTTWRMQSIIGDGDTNEAYMAVDDGTLSAAVRTHGDHHTRLFQSLDGGNQWKDCGPLTLPMQHPGHLLVCKDACLLLTFGIRNKGLMAIGGRFSLNRGKSWLAPFVLHRFPDATGDCGYPSSLMLDQGQVLTGFYTDDSIEYSGYQFGTIQWQLSDFLSLRQLLSLSNGGAMSI